jgi:nucleotide-binding universal stress UspA family protein
MHTGGGRALRLVEGGAARTAQSVPNSRSPEAGTATIRTASPSGHPAEQPGGGAADLETAGGDTLLVGVDWSETARLAVRWAAGAARLSNDRVVAVHGISPWTGWELALPPFDYDDYRKAVTKAMTDEWCTPLELVPHECATSVATPEEALLGTAGRLHPRLIVLGSHGHGLFSRHLLGSVTAKLLHGGEWPIAVVPPEAPMRFRRLVVGVDGTGGAKAALQWAVGWAGAVDGTIEAVCVRPPGPYAEHPQLGDPTSADPMTSTLGALARMVEPFDGKGGVSIESEVTVGHPAAELVRLAGDRADILVVGSRGRGPLHELMLGSTSRACATHSTVPVVVVPSPQTPEEAA